MSEGIGRKELLKRAAAVAVGTTAAFSGASGRAGAAPPTKGTTSDGAIPGTVVDVTGDPSVVNVIEDSRATRSTAARTVRVRTTLRHRRLRSGDRVVIGADSSTGQTLTSPLFLSLDGLIERLSERELTIQGRVCRIDEHSVCYRTSGSKRALLGKLQNSPHVRQGKPGAVLCVDNRNDHTLTVQALYLSS